MRPRRPGKRIGMRARGRPKRWRRWPTASTPIWRSAVVRARAVADDRVMPVRTFGDPRSATPSTPAGATVDVLALIDPKVHKRNGTWDREGAAIVTPGGASVCLEFPVAPTPTYRLEAVVEQHDG